MKTKHIIGMIVIVLGLLLVSKYSGGGSSIAKPLDGGAKAEMQASESLAEPFSDITEADFKKFLADKPDTVVIDIRTPGEIALGKIVESPLEIDYYGKTFLDELGKLDKSKTYFIYCAHANRSRDAKEKMRGLGFTKVYDLKGGFITWKGQLFGAPDRTKIVQQFLGKPSFVVFAGTYCPHCQNAMPKYKSEVYDKFGDKINVLVNVVDGNDGKRFEQDIPQDFQAKLSYNILAGEECGYVPSFVVLDRDGEAKVKSCGGKVPLESAIETIKNLKGVK